MAKVKAFRCSRTGVYFPADYIEQWGIKYGIGLGSTPVSEALINSYHQDIEGQPREPGKTMYPMAVCRAQVDLVEIEETEYNAKKAVLAKDDKDYQQRAAIMRSRQVEHSSKIAGIDSVNISSNI